jgi:predicted O-linked N-acetylglucosamine transferase (SPINDLY family)
VVEGYLSSALMEPENGQEHYTEQLVLLPGSGLCYPRVIHPPADVDPRKYGLPEEGFFFQAQMASKALPKHDSLYREIAEASGKPIVFLEPKEEFNREKLVNRLKAAKINAVVLPRLPVAEFLGLISKADAVLDTPEWNGGNTTIDALNLGKPVVSVAGEFMRGRHTLAFATIAGAPGLIAKDLKDYVSLALDKDRLAAAMEHLNAAALYEDRAPVAALDEVLLTGTSQPTAGFG